MANKNMNPIFSIKNFRSFGEDGADFELAPITVLTGCNSAGKSSLVKALLLLSDGEAQNTGGFIFSDSLKISSKKLCLGGYTSVSNGGRKIVMSYRIWSANLQEELIVKREFSSKHNDALNDGSLCQLTVEKTDGTIIFESPSHEGLYSTNRDAVREEFNRLYAVGCYMYFMEVLLPLIEHREKKQSDNGDITLNRRSKSVINLVIERLKSAGVTESEAAPLWTKINHDTWKEVIKSMETKLGFGENLIVTLKDIEKKPDELEWEIMIDTFIKSVVNDACSPFFLQNIAYVNSASAIIARLYSTEEDNKMCNTLRVWNNRRIRYYNEDLAPDYVMYKPGSFLNKWIGIEKFNIGDSIEVKGTDEGLGLMTYLHKGKEKRLLADEGYGITQLVSLLLQTDNAIPLFVRENESYSDLMPCTICVEEPEVHLHPKYQSLLAEMFVEAYQKHNIRFIIETHSEYLIRKLQVMVADKENALTSTDVSLNYVEKDVNGVSTNRKIDILEDGRLSKPFGSGFFDESKNLVMRMMKL